MQTKIKNIFFFFILLCFSVYSIFSLQYSKHELGAGILASSEYECHLKNDKGLQYDPVLSKDAKSEPFSNRMLNIIAKKEQAVLSAHSVIKKHQIQIFVAPLIVPDYQGNRASKYYTCWSASHLLYEFRYFASDSSPPLHSIQIA